MAPEIDPTPNSNDVAASGESSSDTPHPESISANSEQHDPKAACKRGAPQKENKHWLEYFTADFAFGHAPTLSFSSQTSYFLSSWCHKTLLR
jgi:hypothetical protein